MLVLAIDTATAVCSVALAQAGKLLADMSTNLPRTHSQRLLPMIDAVLAEAGVVPRDLELLAVARGPGSFTGIRLGIATVKGLGLALGLPVAGISTLLGLANNFNSGLVCPALNARLGQVYAALYRTGAGHAPDCVFPEQAIAVNDLLTELKAYTEPIWFCGDGAELVLAAAAGGLTAPRWAGHLADNRAASLAILAPAWPAVAADTLTPYYIRESQAEIMLKAKAKQG